MDKHKRIKNSKLFKFLLIPTILIIAIFSWTILIGKTMQFANINKAKFSELSVNQIERQSINDETDNNETEDEKSLYDKFHDFYGDLSPDEKTFIFTKPGAALQIYECSKLAKAEALYYYDGSLYKDNGDAFRHTYWNALMVKYVGVDDAKTYADAHESGDDSQGVDKEMDLFNNEKGRKYGLEYLDLSDQEIAKKIIQHVSQGDCVQIFNDSPQGEAEYDILIESNVIGLRP